MLATNSAQHTACKQSWKKNNNGKLNPSNFFNNITKFACHNSIKTILLALSSIQKCAHHKPKTNMQYNIDNNGCKTILALACSCVCREHYRITRLVERPHSRLCLYTDCF